jgi:hypothetical protein
MTPWYTDQEIDDLCEGLVNNAAKARHLRGMGLTVTLKPNGRPLVMRTHAEAVLSGLQQIQAAVAQATRNKPDRAALVLAFGRGRATSTT